MMKKVLMSLSAVTLLTLSASAMAAGNVAAGQQKSATCAGCHGATGNETLDASYPRLAGQHASYLEQALAAYRSGERKNPIMAGFAAALSDQDISDLSAYFASQDSTLGIIPEGQ
jgi:cytochrome c553